MNLPAASVGRIDPAFQFPGLGLPETDDPAQAAACWHHLGQRVRRDGLDLDAHAQRVLMACCAERADRLPGALLDMFVALGAQGGPLKRGLLRQATPWLATETAQALGQHLGSAWPAQRSLPGAGSALLHSTIVGTTQLVHRERAVQRELSRTEQAVAMINDGDLEGARETLETGLLESPDDADLLSELMSLYHHLRDDAARASMAARLLAAHGRLPVGWT